MSIFLFPIQPIDAWHAAAYIHTYNYIYIYTHKHICLGLRPYLV